MRQAARIISHQFVIIFAICLSQQLPSTVHPTKFSSSSPPPPCPPRAATATRRPAMPPPRRRHGDVHLLPLHRAQPDPDQEVPHLLGLLPPQLLWRRALHRRRRRRRRRRSRGLAGGACATGGRRPARDPRGRGVLRHEAVRERQLRHRDHAGLLPDRLVPPLLRRRRPRSRRRRSPGGGAPGRRRRRLAAGESDGSPRHAAAPRRRFPAVRLTGDDRYSGNEGHHRRRVTTAFGSDGRRSCTLIRLHMIKKKKNSASIVR